MRQIKGMKADVRTTSLGSRPWVVTLVYSLIVIGVLLYLNRNATDYVGIDNDDAMRLVEVRDLLNGQGWFDMMQYRLGLADGTLMHWSRFIDLPIASLIAFFRLFFAPERAEAIGIAVWPLFLVMPYLAAMALLGRRLGGMIGLHIALIQTAVLIITSNRFLPGSIDHDNVQLGLVALIAAMLVDARYRPLSFAVAAVACAVAIGIGAETTPFVAIVCMTVAGLWAWEGKVFSAAASTFALTLTLAISAAFFATVPPHFYSMVTCDNLSLGFYGITTVGGLTLLASSILASDLSRPWRFVVLAGNGAAVFIATVLLAPQCLRSPLAGLDPMIVKYWLNSVTEAQSILVLSVTDPTSIGAFYATGLLALSICILRIVRGDRAQLHAILLALLAINWIITLVQVRGAEFSNLLAIPVLTLFIMDLRRISNANPESVTAAFFFIVGTLISVPAVWAVGGGFAGGNLVASLMNTSPKSNVADGKKDEDPGKCATKEALAPLAAEPTGVVVAASNLGAPILRFTDHRTLSGPYHRDVDGMLAEMKIGFAPPADAKALLQRAGATLLVYCRVDPQMESFSKAMPDGLYAHLAKGEVPDYLLPIASVANNTMQIYRVKPE